MKIGIQTWGSHGDIRPFIALAEGLQAAGNEVHLVMTCVDSGLYHGLVSQAGPADKRNRLAVLDPVQEEQIGRLAYGIRNPMKQMAAILRLCFAPVEDLMFEAAQQLCAESDLVIGHYFLHPLQVAAEKAGKPHVSVLLSHAGIPSDFNHPLGSVSFGKTAHRLLWALVRSLLNGVLLHYPNRLRAQLGMAPLRDIVTQVWLSPHLTLAAVSPPHLPPPARLAGLAQVCGFRCAHLGIDGTLPAPLAAFLDGGAAPVYMTFGSWMPKDIPGQTRALKLMTEAARCAGCRAIIQSDAAQACGFVSDRTSCMSRRRRTRRSFRAAAPSSITAAPAPPSGDPGRQALGRRRQHQRAGTLGARTAPPRHRWQAGAAPQRERGGTRRRIRQVLASPQMTVRAQVLADGMRGRERRAGGGGVIMRNPPLNSSPDSANPPHRSHAPTTG